MRPLRSLWLKNVLGRPRGFSLIELMVVLSIVVIIAGFAIPSLSGISHGNDLGEAANQVNGYLKLARQSATTLNLRVEMRFYKFSDPFAVGRPAAYYGYQAWQLSDDSTVSPIPITKLQRLPRSVLLESNPSYSSLLDPAQNTVALTTQTTPKIDGQTASYTGFHFNRDGTSDLSITGKWFLSLHYASLGDNLSTLPPNYAAIRMDPITGATTVYRP